MKEKTIGILGKTKTGKTRNIIFKEIEEQIQNNKSLLILDEKKEYYNNFFEELKKNGYNIKVVNFKEPLKSNGWDPLEYIYYLYINGKTDKAIELIQNMGQALFKTNDADPFWTNMASSYFTGLVLILIKTLKEEGDASALKFYSTLSVIQDGDEKIGDSTYLLKYLQNLDTMDPIYIALSPIAFAPTETRGSILAVVKQKLNLFFTRPQLLKSFCNNGFKVSSLIDEEKFAIFVIGYKPINLLTNVLMEQCFNVVEDYKKDITFVIDSIDNLPKIEFIEDMINLANRDKMTLIGTVTDERVIAEKYNSLMPFRNLEKVIKLDEMVDLEIEDKEYDLPDLEDGELVRFDFKKYVK